MKNTFLLLGITAILSSCSQPAPQEKAAMVDSSSVSITRGEYLVNTSGCNDCHSPKMMTDKGPVPDPALLLSGHPENLPLPGSDTATSNHWILFHMGGTAAKGPWGTSFAANLTPDPTGLGNWSEEQFFNAMRKGYYKGIEGGAHVTSPDALAGLCSNDGRRSALYFCIPEKFAAGKKYSSCSPSSRSINFFNHNIRI